MEPALGIHEEVVPSQVQLVDQVCVVGQEEGAFQSRDLTNYQAEADNILLPGASYKEVVGSNHRTITRSNPLEAVVNSSSSVGDTRSVEVEDACNLGPRLCELGDDGLHRRNVRGLLLLLHRDERVPAGQQSHSSFMQRS